MQPTTPDNSEGRSLPHASDVPEMPGISDVAPVDPQVGQPTRLGDVLLGGVDNFAVDRKAIEQMAEVLPGGIDTGRRFAEASRAFRERVVTRLVRDEGIRQFLQIGIGVPRLDDTHRMAQAIDPTARVVYWINDPVVLAHAHELQSTPEGSTQLVGGDFERAETIIDRATRTLELNEPIAVMFTALTFIREDDVAEQVVRDLVADLCPGSYLMISHLASDIGHDQISDTMKRRVELMEQKRISPLVARDREQVTRYFDGLELVPPGVVPVDDWHPDPTAPALAEDEPPAPLHGGLARVVPRKRIRMDRQHQWASGVSGSIVS